MRHWFRHSNHFFRPWTNLSRYHLCWYWTKFWKNWPQIALVGCYSIDLCQGWQWGCFFVAWVDNIYERTFCCLFLGKITGFMSFSSANSCNVISAQFVFITVDSIFEYPNQCLLFAVEIHHNSIFNFYSLSPTRDRKMIYLLS